MGRATLQESLESVAKQTYPRIEIVVVNAKGADHPELPSRCGRFPLKLIHSDRPLPRGRAANVGLDHSTGNYLIFLDDDDLFFPDHIASLVQALRHSKQARCAYAGVRVEYYLNGRFEREGVFNRSFDQLQLWTNNFIPIHAVLFERSLCREGCRFDEDLNVYEDWDFWVQLSQRTTFVHLDQVSACYRNFGFSGLGLQFDERFVMERNALFYDKWKNRWTGEQLARLIQRSDGLMSQFQALEEQVETFRLKLAASDAEAGDSTARLEAQQARTGELETSLAASQAEARESALRLEVQQARTGELEARLAASQAEAGQVAPRLEAALADRDHTIQLLRNSTSWRITAPLRGLSLSAGWLVRNGRRTLMVLWWLGAGRPGRALSTLVAYYRRRVPLHIKLMIPDSVRNAAKRLLAVNDVGLSQDGAAENSETESIAARDSETESIEVEEKYFFDLSAAPIGHTQVNLIAFYLPQFHAIPENDRWWGDGFTEWTNVGKGRPLFDGHHQPRLPAQLGYYDLKDIEVYARQVKLAKKAGIYGFCFHFYWFGGKTLLEDPLRNMLAARDIDQPFCLCWANENWTRSWDGLENEILIAQDHGEMDSLRFLEYVNTYFGDDRYIKIDGKPLLVVYRPELIPNMMRTQRLWREHAKTLGWPGIYLVSAQVFGQEDPGEFEFDAAVEFPPHNAAVLNSMKQEASNLDRDFKGRIFDYTQLAGFFRMRLPPHYKLFRSVMLEWDNTARRDTQATIFCNFSLTGYARWLFSACRACLADPRLAAHEKLVFINAWNEWGEGTYLEPDNKYGLGYLQATKRVVNACAVKRPRLSVVVPNYNHARFLERRLHSIIHQSHKPDEIIFLDDASADDSIAIARDILGKSNIKFTILENELNSGSVFRQWLKGIEEASGDLIWIAESDDSAGLDFLANILPRFDREDVLLAYGEIRYINPDDTPHPGLDHYYDEVEGLNGLSWEHSNVVSAYRAFTGAFAIKNIIPNVSGAVFRKPCLSAEEIERLTSYTFAGDWYFYSLIARGGAVAFCREARSYFRLNRESTSRQAFFSARHVREHRMILQDLRGLYGIAEAVIRGHVRALWGVLKHRLPDISQDELAESLEVEAGEQRSLRICIASYGFVVGGGEVVPIELANALRARGHSITFLVLVREFEEDSPLLRHRLRSDIPVVFWDDVKQAFAEFLDEFGIEVFNSHNFGVEYHLYRERVDMNIPYIASLHGGYEQVGEALLTPGLMNYVSKNVDEWLYLADKNIAPLTARGVSGARFTRSFNAPVLRPANVGWELDIRSQLNLGDDALLLMLASRAARDKGWERAIEATARVRQASGRDCRLLLIGDGPDFRAIHDANADKEFVHFLGRLENPGPVIKACDIGIFPSTFSGESFPLFVLECLQSGLPVVATDIGVIPEMVTVEGETAGCVVSASQSDAALVDEMVQALTQLATDEKTMLLARQLAVKAAARFSMDRLVDFYLDVMSQYIE